MNPEPAVFEPQMAQMTQIRRPLGAPKAGASVHAAGANHSMENGFIICAVCAICG